MDREDLQPACLVGQRWLAFVLSLLALHILACLPLTSGTGADGLRRQAALAANVERVATSAGKIVLSVVTAYQDLRGSGQPWSAPVQQEAGIKAVAVASCLVLYVVMAVSNSMGVDVGNICPAHAVWYESHEDPPAHEQCVCDDKFVCDGCHDEYPRDEGFVIGHEGEAITSGWINPSTTGQTYVCVPECIFSQGILIETTLQCGCAAGFVATESKPGWGATACAPAISCTAADVPLCHQNSTCAHLEGAPRTCVCNRLYFGDGESCKLWTPCDTENQYMSRAPDATRDRQCTAATVCGAAGELSPLKETRDRVCN